jgi:hypothetical protein
VVARLLARQPGLRAIAVASSSPESTSPESTISVDPVAGLVALRAYLTGDEPEVDDVLRSGPRPGKSSVAASIVSGLARLPTLSGPVYRGAAPDAIAPERCRPGTVVAEPAFVQAASSARAFFGTDAEYVIWSRTGRRVTMLEPGSGRADVVFEPGTRFAVVAVCDRPGPGGVGAGSRPTVVLAEASPGDAAGRVSDDVRERLERAVLAREAARPPAAGPDAAGCPQTFALGRRLDLPIGCGKGRRIP